jgi:hypothetical protein
MLPSDDPVVANRRARLRAWIDTHFGGSHTLFIASTNNGEKQLNQGELSALLKNKSFGERRARSLEAMAHMPARYLDDMQSSGVYSTHSVREDAPSRTSSGARPLAAPAAPVGWPFSRVTLARIVKLKKDLGPKNGSQAMQDIDETLELVVSKWERRATLQSKSAA